MAVVASELKGTGESMCETLIDVLIPSTLSLTGDAVVDFVLE